MRSSSPRESLRGSQMTPPLPPPNGMFITAHFHVIHEASARTSRDVERFTHDIEDARDVTQDVFIKVYGALDSFDPRFKFSTWLFRIAGNAAIDHLRRRRVRLLPLERPAWELSLIH